MDVKIAFLHCDSKEDTYMTRPKGFVVPRQENKVYKLRKLYSLKKEPKQWYEKNITFMDNGFVVSSYGTYVYSKMIASNCVIICR